MLPVVLKVALVVFLVICVVVLVVTFIRKSRAKGFPTPESDSQFWQIKGAMPPNPKPDRMEPDADDERQEGRQI
ncbi:MULTISPECIES: hypothetical protein [unclassified Mycobacterium]|uniref:hypothetical protein n=1 Tax=unclassified Mycobacterium TaxID=2642494 RepID=UPI0029C79D48|nr:MULTISPECIES: hypothetical protein [unclassified Mycobacterium]